MPSTLIPTRISNPVWMRHVDFCSGKPQRHKSLTVNANLALKIQQNLHVRLHVMLWRLRPEVRVHSQA